MKHLGKAILLGLLLTLPCLMLAFGMAGGGHGWVTPFLTSWLGPIIFPLAIWRWFRRSHGDPLWHDAIALVVILCGDALIVVATMNEGVGYVSKVGWLAWVWAAMWIAFQSPIVFAFTGRTSGGADAEIP